MPETLNLNYYYGNEADQYSFYRIPKILLTDRHILKTHKIPFKPISSSILTNSPLNPINPL